MRENKWIYNCVSDLLSDEFWQTHKFNETEILTFIKMTKILLMRGDADSMWIGRAIIRMMLYHIYDKVSETIDKQLLEVVIEQISNPEFAVFVYCCCVPDFSEEHKKLIIDSIIRSGNVKAVIDSWLELFCTPIDYYSCWGVIKGLSDFSGASKVIKLYEYEFYSALDIIEEMQADVSEEEQQQIATLLDVFLKGKTWLIQPT